MPSNFTKTGVLLILLTAIFVAMGALVGGTEGMVIAFVVAIGMNAFSFWNSDTVVLKMFKAQELSRTDAPQLHDVVGKLSQRAGLPMPRVYLLPSPQPNAFATGRSPDRAAVAVSTGLLDQLSLPELAGVIAHELAHVKNRDTLTMTIAATIGGAISMFANMLQFGALFGSGRRSPFGWLGLLGAMLIAPLAAMIVQMAISRSREYEADRIGAAICGNPLWLASALQKIQAVARQVQNQDAQRVPAAAHLFIINPLTGTGMDNWFSTHPDTSNRIAELERLAHEWQQSSNAPTPLELDDHMPQGPWQQDSEVASNDRNHAGPWGPRA